MKVQLFSKVIITVFLSAILIFTLPFFYSFLHPDISFVRDNINGFNPTLWKTIVYAICCSLMLVSVGFGGAVFLRNVDLLSKTGRLLGILILPITLGNLSIAFIAKLLIGDSAFFSHFANNTFFYKAIFVYGLQLWQYGFLFIYLYWLNFKDISPRVLEYAKAQQFSRFQLIKDVLLPSSKNLTILLVLLGILLTVFDDAKITYLFKVSQGTDSELITNWLGRNYQSSLLLNTSAAEKLILSSGNFVFLFLLAAILVVYGLVQMLFRLWANWKVYPASPVKKGLGRRPAAFAGILLVTAVLLPLLWLFFKVNLFSINSFSGLRFSMIMVLFAAILASSVAILFAILARLAWPVRLASFNSRSLYFFMGVFLLMLIPPIIILVCGFKTMAFIGYRSTTAIYACWIVGHSILSLPMLSAFIVFNHFRLTNNELHYLSVYRLKTSETIQYSFLRRFKAEYLLLFIISYANIWNESVLNNLFSDYIPSFASQLKMTILGSGADYSEANGYLLVSLIISIVSVVIWQLILKQAQLKDPSYEEH